MQNMPRMLSAAAFGALVLTALPGAAQSADSDELIGARYCAVLYDAVARAEGKTEVADLDFAAAQRRRDELIWEYGLEATSLIEDLEKSDGDLGMMAEGFESMLYPDPFPENPIFTDEAKHSTVFSTLVRCDENFGFTPAFSPSPLRQ